MEDVQSNGIPATTITGSAAISDCKKDGQWQRALRLMKEMQGKGIPANTTAYNAAIRACVHTGHPHPPHLQPQTRPS